MSAIILIVFIIALGYHTQKSPLRKNNQSLLARHKRLIILIALTFIPFLVINAFFPAYNRTPVEILEDMAEKGNEHEKNEAYDVLFAMYPDSLPLRFKYIDQFLEHRITGCDRLLVKRFSTNQKINQQSIDYAKASCSDSYYQYDNYSTEFLSIEPNNEPYQNYIQGVQAYNRGDFIVAKKCFLTETKINPNYPKTYLKLLDLYRFFFKDELQGFILDERFATHLPLSTQRYYYFKYNQIGPYFGALTEQTFSDVDKMAFIAALVISIVWLIFLRSMDIYHKERWVDIILVFIGGLLFTNLCLPFYDYFHFTLDFHINGEGLNDFLYCTIVIGGSEEIVKLIPWVIFALFTKKMKEPYDYLLYASVSALGFTFVENWSYLENPGNIVTRSIMSTVGHMFDASVIAYAIVLARFKVKKKALKLALPIIGFVLACLSHGFYDFWLISPAFKGLYLLTFVFFILTLHIWFFLKNNAINNSKFYNKTSFNSDKQLNILTIGIIGILMAEYSIIGIQYGAPSANQAIGRHGWIIVLFLMYMTVIITNIEIIPGKWRRYSIPIPSFFKGSFNLPGFSGNVAQEKNHVGLSLRLFVRQSNTYVSDLFPVSGFCVEKIEISNNDDWYLFKLNNPLNYPGHNSDHVVIRTKSMNEELDKDKVEIILLFIPDSLFLGKGELEVREFIYTGRAFTRPI